MRFAQQFEVDSETAIGGFGAGDRLKCQIDRCAFFDARMVVVI